MKFNFSPTVPYRIVFFFTVTDIIQFRKIILESDFETKIDQAIIVI